MLFALITSRELQWIQSQASLLLYIQSTWYPDARKAKVAKLGNPSKATAHPVSTKNSAEAQSSSRHESAAKQLTFYEELKAGCQLLSSIQMAKTTRRNQRSRWKESMAEIES
ncbi:subtilase family protein [Dorcoceras hygrometricum]|uniref:Subtilase family protein n=1 Tax=Dorcoceras hygrometricum TaxID=472368 RepID=A0A2Z7B2I7_9LAMI|nr:subtilase family protein [Dorcoceras hygrometricum]